MPDHFVGIGDLATFMGVTTADLTTALADLAVSAAESKVRAYTDQQITIVNNDVVYLDGNGRRKLRLPERPVLSVSLVEEGSGDPVWTSLDSDAYHLRDSILIRWDGSVWVPGEANLRVTYSHGYLTGAVDSDFSDSDYDVQHVPADLSLATLSLARRMYENIGADEGAGSLGGIKQETIGSYSYTLSSAFETAAGVELIQAERNVLDAYKMNGWTAH
jgi:hypothetical protein